MFRSGNKGNMNKNYKQQNKERKPYKQSNYMTNEYISDVQKLGYNIVDFNYNFSKSFNPNFPSTEEGKEILFNLGDKTYKIDTLKIKIKISEDINKYRSFTDNINILVDNIYSLLQRITGRKLDYVIPEIDTELLEQIIKINVDEEEYNNKLDRIITFSQDQRIQQTDLYYVYRSLMPTNDLSAYDNYNNNTLYKVYRNLLLCREKIKYSEQRQNFNKKGTVPYSNVNDYICALDYIDKRTPLNNRVKNFITATLCLQLSTIWDGLLFDNEFLREEDYVFFDVEDTTTTQEGADRYIKELKNLKQRKQETNDELIINLLCDVADIVKQYKNDSITIIDYDDKYRSLMFKFLLNYVNTIEPITERKIRSDNAFYNPVKDEKYTLHTLFNKLKGVSKEVSYNVNETIIDEIMKHDKNIIAEIIAEEFSNGNSQLILTLILFIKNCFIKDYKDLLLTSLKKLNYNYSESFDYVGNRTFANLFRLNMIVEDKDLFNMLIDKAKQQSEIDINNGFEYRGLLSNLSLIKGNDFFDSINFYKIQLNKNIINYINMSISSIDTFKDRSKLLKGQLMYVSRLELYDFVSDKETKEITEEKPVKKVMFKPTTFSQQQGQQKRPQEKIKVVPARRSNKFKGKRRY